MKTVTKTKTKAKAGATTAPRKKSVHIRLDPAIHQQIHQLAEAEQRNLSQFIERLLKRHIQEQNALAKYFQPGVTYPIFTPYGAEAAAAKLTELLEGQST